MLSLIFAFLLLLLCRVTFRALPLYCGLACGVLGFFFNKMVMGRGDGFYIVVGILDYSFQYYKIRKRSKIVKMT